LQNGIKQHAKFLAKKYQFSILDFGLRRAKKAKNPSPTPSFCRMELNSM
jgi:hypothetical protein